MHCNSCHGEAGGLRTRSYRELMLGGNLGKLILPGDPEKSLLVHFIDGRRGDQNRMPKEGRPLSSSQIDIIRRRWIAEGAKDDRLPVKQYRFSRTSVPVEAGKVTRVFCRVNAQAYLMITARDPGNGRVLWTDVASVKSPKEGMDAAEPGQIISWDLRSGPGWPDKVELELLIEHAASDPRPVEFYATSPEHRPFP
jgi:hypothetical protein